MNVKLYNYYEAGIQNKKLLATFDVSGEVVRCKREKYDKSDYARTLWGEYMTPCDYINNALARLVNRHPKESDEPEYRYVYNYEYGQKIPVACVVKVGSQFGVSIASDKKDIKYSIKLIYPSELPSHRFAEGEFLTEEIENDVVKSYMLYTPTGYKKDAFNYKQAREIAHNHLGQTTLIPRRTVHGGYGHDVELSEIIPEMMENWYTV